MTGERNWSLDLIRALAVVEVLAVHFFSNIQYYEEPLAGTAMVAAAFLRPALMTCVPLFLLLSGYLCVGQTWSRDYYWRLGRVVSVYLLASAACLLFKAVAMEGSWNPLIWCREILNFNGAPYSWYIEMYLGLFLLIPFINAAWRGVDRAGRLALTASLMCMAILPSAANLSRYTDAQVQLVPGWWEKLYPLAYYCLGAWLREHPIRLRGPVLLGLAALCPVAGGALHLWRADGGAFGYLDITYWNGLLTAVAAVLVFSVLVQWRPRCPGWLRRSVTGLSRLSLTVYLVSWIPDQVIGALLVQRVPDIGRRLLWGLAAVPASLLVSVALAWCIQWPERLILWGLGRIRTRCARENNRRREAAK